MSGTLAATQFQEELAHWEPHIWLHFHLPSHATGVRFSLFEGLLFLMQRARKGVVMVGTSVALGPTSQRWSIRHLRGGPGRAIAEGQVLGIFGGCRPIPAPQAGTIGSAREPF